MIERLPDGPFGHFAITEQDPDVVWQFIQVFAGQCYANAYWQTLPQRTGRDINPGKYWRRMPLQPTTKLTQRQQFFVRNSACGLVHRVKQRRGMSLREYKMVLIW